MLIISWAIAAWIVAQIDDAKIEIDIPIFLMLFDFVLFLTLIFAIGGLF